MRVWPLRAAEASVDAAPALNAACAGCGLSAGRFAHGRAANGVARHCCVLCLLPDALDRPRIDDEAQLVWLPELAQPAISVLVRRMHQRLHALAEPLLASEPLLGACGERDAIRVTRAALAPRVTEVADRLGTASPRELGRALARLPAAATRRRDLLISGLRLWPLGRFFVGDRDVYPEIVAAWAGSA